MANPDDIRDLAAIIYEASGTALGGSIVREAIAEAILSHPASRWNACPHLAQGDGGSNYCRLAEQGVPGAPLLTWSEERQPCEDCRYNHHLAETPFGRFVIAWKGWKELDAVTVYESPWDDLSWLPICCNPDEAMAACEAEYRRRLLMALQGNGTTTTTTEEPADD
jgi:hypothetical protein